MNKPKILCAGETLWDVLPAGEFVGGAPFNVAGHAARIGAHALLATRLGKDSRGRRALDQARSLGIDLSLVQIDPKLPTGEARAVLDAAGSAHYEFLSPAAWDALTVTPALLDAASSADAFVYGTLGQRDARAHAAITELAARARWRVFDPNLRPPHVDRAICEAGLHGAGLVKVNEDECRVFAEWFGCDAAPESLWALLAARFAVGALCVTLGAASGISSPPSPPPLPIPWAPATPFSPCWCANCSPAAARPRVSNAPRAWPPTWLPSPARFRITRRRISAAEPTRGSARRSAQKA